jgi:hypothetical protein
LLLLKIDATITIDLKVEQRRSDPLIQPRLILDVFEAGDEAVLPNEADREAVGKPPADDFTSSWGVANGRFLGRG